MALYICEGELYYHYKPAEDEPAATDEDIRAAYDRTVTPAIERGLRNLVKDADGADEQARRVQVRDAIFARLAHVAKMTVLTPETTTWSMGSGGLHEYSEIVMTTVSGQIVPWTVDVDPADPKQGSIKMYLHCRWRPATEVTAVASRRAAKG